MPPPTYSQAQSTAAEAPPPSAPFLQATSAGQADGPQEPPDSMPSSLSVLRQQQGNILQHAADAPGQQTPYPLSESAQAQTVIETAGSRQEPPLVSRVAKPPPQAHLVTADAAPAAATAPHHVHAQPGTCCSAQELTTQIKQMKNAMIHYASLLDNPVWKQQQPDGGKAVSITTPCVNMYAIFGCRHMLMLAWQQWQ